MRGTTVWLLPLRVLVCQPDRAFARKRREWNFRVLYYISDFLKVASSGRAASLEDGEDASVRIGRSMKSLGLARHRKRGVFGRVRESWNI